MFYCVLLPKALVLPLAYVAIALDLVAIVVFFIQLTKMRSETVPSVSLGLFFAATILSGTLPSSSGVLMS